MNESNIHINNNSLYCWKCGKDLCFQVKQVPKSKYCSNCGARIVKPVQPPNSNPQLIISNNINNNNNDLSSDTSIDMKLDDNIIELERHICLNDDQHIINDSHKIRGDKWIDVLGIHELRTRFHPNLYEKLLNTPTFYLRKIRKDIKRTFPDHTFFKNDPNNNKRTALENILIAYSVYDSEIGYSQGMAFIVGQLLLHMNEESTFWCFVKLMYSPKHNLRDIFDGDCEVLPLCLKEFDNILARTRPKLFEHLQLHGLDATMYATQWFLTVFIYRFPSDCVPLIWDRFVSIGIIVIFQVGLAILTYFSLDLLQQSSETLIPFFNSLDKQNIPDEIIQMSSNIRVSWDEFLYIRKFFSPDLPFISDGVGRKREISL